MDTCNTIDIAHSPINLFFNWLTCHCKCGRRGGLIISELNSGGASGPGSSSGLGHHGVFLGKTLCYHSASCHPGV